MEITSKSYLSLLKAIVAGVDPCMVSRKIIDDDMNGWQIHPSLNKVSLLLFELSDSYRSLKELELFMGEDIRESTVSFNLMNYPTESEIKELVTYCMHDVRMTYKVYQELYHEYDAQMGLIEYFNLQMSMLNKTKTQLSAYILGAKKPRENRDDAFDFDIIDTIKLSKYKFAKEWYLDRENRDFKKSLKAFVYGVLSDFSWGGFHSARRKYEAENFIVNSDVSSFYPAIMIYYQLLSRNVLHPEKFKEIMDTRLWFKSQGNPIEKSLKIVLNGTFGGSKDANNDLYDPRQGNAVCVNGQLLLLDLIEKVELEFGDNAVFIQGNTDGVMFKFNSQKDVDRYMEICNEWCFRTKMNLEHDFIDKIIQKDVNNYIYLKSDGTIKRKGAYVKKLSLLDNDLPIVNKALVEKMLNNTPIEDTINNATNLIDFQKCVKITGKYSHALHGTKELDLKVLRVFASKSATDSSIMKVKAGSNPEKIGNTPNRVFIDNDNILNKQIPDKLDREWYIELAKKRLDDFMPEQTYDLFDYLDSL